MTVTFITISTSRQEIIHHRYARSRLLQLIGRNSGDIFTVFTCSTDSWSELEQLERTLYDKHLAHEFTSECS